jgi:DNA-binding transcriptional regulator YiaG
MTSMRNVDVDELSCDRYLRNMIPAQCRAARAWLDWKQDALANASGVGLSTIRDFESGKRSPIAANLAAMKVALEREGIVFGEGDALGITAKK